MHKYKIVLVENDEDEQMFMREGFEASGLFDIITQVKNGDLLLQYLEDNRSNLPDVILSDLNMPGKNGMDIINEITSNPEYRHIPVIITSTSSTKSIIDKCMAAGASDYVVKPDTFIDYVPFVQDLYKRIEQKALIKQN